MADTNNIYFAGFFDGEGCVAIYKRKYVVSLTNTDIRPLKEAQSIWGGFLSTQEAIGRKGAIRDLWRWQIYGHSARRFLEDILPYVRVKKEQIDVYLGALNHIPHLGGKYSDGDSQFISESATQLRLLKRGIA
jgi:hypothetical protein